MRYPYIVKGFSQQNERYPERNYIDFFGNSRNNSILSEGAPSETTLKYEVPKYCKRVYMRYSYIIKGISQYNERYPEQNYPYIVNGFCQQNERYPELH